MHFHDAILHDMQLQSIRFCAKLRVMEVQAGLLLQDFKMCVNFELQDQLLICIVKSTCLRKNFTPVEQL